MKWRVVFGRSARRSLKSIPNKDVSRIEKALRDMENDPFVVVSGRGDFYLTWILTRERFQ